MFVETYLQGDRERESSSIEYFNHLGFAVEHT